MIAHVPIRAGKDDLIRVSEANPGWKVELDAHGTLHLTPPAGGRTGRRNWDLSDLLNTWAIEHDFARFDSSTGFELPDRSVVQPDAAFVRGVDWRGLTEKQQEDFVPLAPAVAVELVSKTDRPSELREKLLRMRALGTGYAVLVDPYRREVWTDGERPPGFLTDFTTLFDV